jgi:hypothetical protein
MHPRFKFRPLPGDDAQPARPRRATPAPDSATDVSLPGPSCALPPSEAPPKSTPAASADLVAAVRRLTALCAEHLATAPRLGLQASPDHLLRVVDAALAEATDGPLPGWGGDIEGYFLQGIYEELIQQPANLFTGTRLLHGEEVPVPISTDNWIECLRVFRAAILRGDVVVPATKPTAHYLGERRPGHLFVPVLDGDSAPATDLAADALRSPPAHLSAIKKWTRDILGLAEDDVITINELACRDPGCPLLETIIAVFAEGVTMRWKFSRPGCAVTKTMLRQTLTTAPG